MTLAITGTLLLLALIDSTSFGTLGIPVLMLVQRRVRARALVVYLLVLSGFYFALGLVLLAGAEGLATALARIGTSATFAWIQLGLGVLLVAVSFLVDRRGTEWRRQRRAARGLAPRESRANRLKDQLLGAHPSLRTVASVAVVAGLIEAVSMIPYLGAIGLLTQSDLAAVGKVGVLAGYVVVMALPALLLLGLRLLAHRAIAPILDRVNRWIERNQAEMLGWTLGIVGVLLALNAWQQLQQLGAV
ncbi:GAP family protein [Epidermidibacterium keratini]|uniref:GAP family protein n=1 Tax=Epidermidibacterium keratini TaxID=1891644 RepID=A0A7L4YP13_9ACTN|nr:GAP family protein [Epidermidibacterium keratini]QHC01021.1 GAP family protein [Epidermidibacterium keratini]